MNRDQIRRAVRSGQTPHDVWLATSNSREAYLIALEEEASQAGELNAFESTSESVVELRDGKNMRWERIAVRIFGDPRQTQAVRELYDAAKGPGASKRSYTGRGRRFPDMQDPDVPTQDAGQAPQPAQIAPASRFFGVSEERAATPERLAEIEVLRGGNSSDIRHYLEQHLYSDRFYFDGDRIWLELPNRTDTPPTGTVLVWFQITSQFEVGSPTAGTRAGRHALPFGWDTTLCTIPLASWTSGMRRHAGADVTCPWCLVRILATDVAVNPSAEPVQFQPNLAHPGAAKIAESFVAFFEDFMPRLLEPYPDAQRLDGRSSGSNREVVGRFMHHGKRWQIHGDTSTEPILIAYEAAKTGRDPFVEAQTNAGRPRLDLTNELQAQTATPRYRHLYIYKD